MKDGNKTKSLEMRCGNESTSHVKDDQMTAKGKKRGKK